MVVQVCCVWLSYFSKCYLYPTDLDEQPQGGEKGDPEKLRREREELEKQQREGIIWVYVHLVLELHSVVWAFL